MWSEPLHLSNCGSQGSSAVVRDQGTGWVSGFRVGWECDGCSLCVKWEDAPETFPLRTSRSQWMRNGSKVQPMCIFHFLLILMALYLSLADLPGWHFKWRQEGRLNCCEEPNISAVHGAGNVRGVWYRWGILRMTLGRPLCLPFGAFLCTFSS